MPNTKRIVFLFQSTQCSEIIFGVHIRNENERATREGETMDWLQALYFRGTQGQFSENICSEDDLRARIFGTFVVKFLACLLLLGFSNI